MLQVATVITLVLTQLTKTDMSSSWVTSEMLIMKNVRLYLEFIADEKQGNIAT